VEFAARTTDKTSTANPGRNYQEQQVNQFADTGPHLIFSQGRQYETHAAVDVETDPAGRYYT
jgi:hypothetical protein